MGRYLALQNIRANDRDILIVRGAWQDHAQLKVWHPVENEMVPPATTVQAGSLVEYDLPQDRLEKAFAQGKLAPADTQLHFDLDRVFDLQVTGSINPKVRLSLADTLREWGIFSLEDLLSGKPATHPIVNDSRPVPVKQLLRRFGSDAQVAMWLRAAENIVGQSKATTVEPTVTPPAE